VTERLWHLLSIRSFADREGLALGRLGLAASLAAGRTNSVSPTTSIAGDGHAIFVPASGPTTITPGERRWEARQPPRWHEEYGREWADKREWRGREREDEQGENRGHGHGRDR
jgi:hypothetical protein